MNSRLTVAVSLAAIAVSAGVLYSSSLYDMDLWWHLATGRHIAETGRLLDTDPFNFTSGADLGLRNVLLNGYWLGQLLLYFVWELGGERGLQVVKVLLPVLALALVAWGAIRIHRAATGATLIVLVLGVLVVFDFIGLRPQLFTFVMIAAVALILESLARRHESQGTLGAMGFALPLVMLLWANLHRGFMIGTLLIGLFAVCGVLVVVRSRSAWRPSDTRYLLVLALGVMASLVNPAGVLPYIELLRFEGSVLQSNITEYLSPITMLNRGAILWGYWVYLFVGIVVTVASARRAPLRWTLVFVVLAAASLRAFRYVPLFVLATAPATAASLSSMITMRPAVGKLMRVVPILAAAGLLVFAVAVHGDNVSMARRHRVLPGRYPEDALRFLQQHLPQPSPIFNHYNWGGYISWRHPEWRTFIDGRVLNLEVFEDYRATLWNPEVSFELLNKYAIKTVLIPERSFQKGTSHPLVSVLARSRIWELVYRDDSGTLIFVRRSALN